MITAADILTCATERVGFRQSSNSDYGTLTATLTNSTSGLYVNDIPGVDFDIIYRALSEDHPDQNTYLANVLSSETLSLVRAVLTASKSKLGVSTLLHEKPFFSGTAKRTDTETGNMRAVGFLLTPGNGYSLNAALTHIGVHLNTIQTNPLKVYLYDCNQEEAIATTTITNTKVNSVEWFALTDWTVKYITDDAGQGSTFLLVYYEADPSNAQNEQLEGEALTLDFNTCNSCGGVHKRINRTPFMALNPVEIPNNKLNWDGSEYTLPTVDDWGSYTVHQTHGINVKMTIACDYTDMICRNISAFDTALHKAVAVRLLRDYLATKNINAVTDADKHVSNALEWSNLYEKELREQLIPEITMDFASLDAICLPCQKGVKIGKRYL